MRIDDRRTDGQTGRLNALVIGRDRPMTELGRSCGEVGPNGGSYAAWACASQDLGRVVHWVEDRSDIEDVTVIPAGDSRFLEQALRGIVTEPDSHVSVYAADSGHPATLADSSE